MLTYYQTQTSRLLQNPAAPTTLYSTTDLNSYINTARGQVAGEGRCVRRIGSLAITTGTRIYAFSAITGLGTETQGAIHIRNVAYSSGTGQLYVPPLSFEYFWVYNLNNAAPVNGPPVAWAQFGQGSASTGSITGEGSGTIISGSIYVDPPPDQSYTLKCDCVCYPAALAADTDVEAIPYLWTDAVPYYAAYMALMSSQTGARIQQAQALFQLYETFMQRARNYANPDVLGVQYSQGPNPARLADVPAPARAAQ